MAKNNFQNIIDILRGKKKPYSEILKNNNIDIPKNLLKNISFEIEGKNNTVRIISPFRNKKLNIFIYGDNNEIIINENVIIGKSLNIRLGFNHSNFGKITNSKFIIGKNTSMEEMNYVTYNSNTHCNIGENCMISYGVNIYNTDAHPILDLNTKKIINKVKGITIGNNCWIGMQTTILKNSTIPNWSILGCGTIFSGNKFSKTNCIFAGNPAKIVKEDVFWDSNGAKYNYIANMQE